MLSELEIELLSLVNAHRMRTHCEALAAEANLQEQAQLHCKNMAEGRSPFGHEGFSERAQHLSKAGGFLSVSENVASGQKTAEQALKAWLDSPPHRKNIEGDYDYTGLSICQCPRGQYYYCQLFGKRPGLKIEPSSQGNMALELLMLMNTYRQGLGLSVLEPHPQIQALAHKHSLAMAKGEHPLGHDFFEERMEGLEESLQRENCHLRIAENVLSATGTAQDLLSAWLQDETNRKHIEGDYRYCGLAAAQNMRGQWLLTQIFVQID